MKVENLKVSFWLVTVSCEHCFHMLARKGGGMEVKQTKRNSVCRLVSVCDLLLFDGGLCVVVRSKARHEAEGCDFEQVVAELLLDHRRQVLDEPAEHILLVRREPVLTKFLVGFGL